MNKDRGMGGHQSPKMQKDEWLTPPEILDALGGFDLDPCAPLYRPWKTASNYYTIQDNGLLSPWNGRVWCNPPYGKEAAHWLKKLAHHGNGIALIFARTETQMFFSEVWGKADSVFFFKGRLTFYHVDGRKALANGGAPSCLVAYGHNNVNAIDNAIDKSLLAGKHIKLSTVKSMAREEAEVKCKITGITEDACRYYAEGGCYAIETCPSGLTIVDPDIYDEIKAERIRQDEKYGKNRKEPPAYWHKAIIYELREARIGYANNEEPPHDYRTEMVQVAALAVAAIESYDRQKEKE